MLGCKTTRLLKAELYGLDKPVKFVTHITTVLLVQISKVLPLFKALFHFTAHNLKTYRINYILLVESSWGDDNSHTAPCHVETQGIFINC